MLPKHDSVFKQLTIDYNGENVKKLMNSEMRAKFGIIPGTSNAAYSPLLYSTSSAALRSHFLLYRYYFFG